MAAGLIASAGGTGGAQATGATGGALPPRPPRPPRALPLAAAARTGLMFYSSLLFIYLGEIEIAEYSRNSHGFVSQLWL